MHRATGENVLRRLPAALALVAVALFASPASAAELEIKAKDDYFTPRYLVVEVGDTVVWFNEGERGHTITSFPGSARPFDSSPRTTTSCEPGLPPIPKDCVEPGDDYAVAFEEKGTYDYYCKIHGTPASRPNPKLSATEQPCGMCGRVVVKAATSPTPARTRTATPTPTPSETESETASPSPSGSPSPTDGATAPTTATGTPLASSDDEGGSGGRVALAVFAIAVLSGIGYLTWRRFLGTA